MRWFTWMAVLGPLGPPDIPQATPLPVPGKTPSQCSLRHFHSPRVQGLRRTSQSGACASPVLSRPPPHNPVTTQRTISPSSPQEVGSSPRDTQVKYKQVQVIQNGMPTSVRAWVTKSPRISIAPMEFLSRAQHSPHYVEVHVNPPERTVSIPSQALCVIFLVDDIVTVHNKKIAAGAKKQEGLSRPLPTRKARWHTPADRPATRTGPNRPKHSAPLF